LTLTEHQYNWFRYFDLPLNRGLLLLLLNAIYLIIFIRFFPNKYGGIGHDYAYWFPRMIAGVYWYLQNGLLSVPWFTPALNGGNLLYADPESIYFSIPQFLAFIVDPLTSITITFATFSMVGMWGMYLLLRHAFACGFPSSFLGAGLFLFNGLFTYRMIVGHLPYHGFMLLPWIMLCVLWPKDRQTIYTDAVWSTGAALMLSYCFYAGGIHYLIPLFLSVMAMGFIYSLVAVGREFRYVWQRGAILLMITGMLCASKLVAAFNVIKNVPREAYLLPGIPNLFDLFIVPIRSLFFAAITRQEANQTFANLQWALDRHEFEYGISGVPLLLLIIVVIRIIIRRSKKTYFPDRIKIKWLLLFATFLILAVPIFANYYSPQWNAFLKRLPVIKNSSTLVRWYALYIPIGILCAMLAFEKFELKPVIKSLSAVLLMALVVVVNLTHDKNFSYVNNYNYRPITQGFSAVKSQGKIPVVEYVGLSATIDAPAQKITYREDNLINIGVSYLLARSSLFGYKLEFFPQKDKLKIGRVDQLTAGCFNMINPSCYLYPDENGCEPGDRFRTDQIHQLTNFINYRPYKFELPLLQRIANWMSLVSFLSCLLFLLVHQMRRYWRHLFRTNTVFDDSEKLTNA
jgi:hypothetical protein